MLPILFLSGHAYRPLNIEAACYTRGLLLVSEAVQNGTASRVLAVAKDLSVSGGSGSREQAPPYKEMVDEMNGGRPLLPGELCWSLCRPHAIIMQIRAPAMVHHWAGMPSLASLCLHCCTSLSGGKETWCVPHMAQEMQLRSCSARTVSDCRCPAAGGVLALSPALTAQQLRDLNEAGLTDEFAVQQEQEPLSFVALTDGGELALGNEQGQHALQPALQHFNSNAAQLVHQSTSGATTHRGVLLKAYPANGTFSPVPCRSIWWTSAHPTAGSVQDAAGPNLSAICPHRDSAAGNAAATGHPPLLPTRPQQWPYGCRALWPSRGCCHVHDAPCWS